MAPSLSCVAFPLVSGHQERPSITYVPSFSWWLGLDGNPSHDLYGVFRSWYGCYGTTGRSARRCGPFRVDPSVTLSWTLPVDPRVWDFKRDVWWRVPGGSFTSRERDTCQTRSRYNGFLQQPRLGSGGALAHVRHL